MQHWYLLEERLVWEKEHCVKHNPRGENVHLRADSRTVALIAFGGQVAMRARAVRSELHSSTAALAGHDLRAIITLGQQGGALPRSKQYLGEAEVGEANFSIVKENVRRFQIEMNYSLLLRMEMLQPIQYL